MKSIEGIGSFDKIPEKFTGVRDIDPKTLGHLAFYLASGQIKNGVLTDDPWFYDAEDWETVASEIIREVQRWKNEYGERVSRFELAKKVEAQYGHVKEVHDLLKEAGNSSADDGLAMVLKYTEAKGFTVRNRYMSSPLFPEGREEKAVLSSYEDEDGRMHFPRDAVICDEKDDEIDPKILTYLTESQPAQKNREVIRVAVSEAGEIDRDTFEELRLKYGAKAAALLCFKEKIDFINEQVKTAPSARAISIPAFEPVGVEVFEAWKSGDETFDEMCEQLRQRAITLRSKNGTYLGSQLTIVRSSAVKSEDGESNTGAGVYQSIAVNPDDKEAFRDAICSVYDSCSSPAALSYQKRIGVTDEQMGLVIQPYLERAEGGMSHTHYGHINSRGANPSLIELHLEHGDLLYDKTVVSDRLMVGNWGDKAEEELHTHPDHNNEVMGHAAHSLGDLAHAAVLAERLFGRPMQLEFVDDHVVQVRPLVGAEVTKHVVFPEEIPVRFEMVGVGVGDMELELLPEYGDNSDKRGFIVVGQEYGFTIYNTYDAFPKEGAVVILSPSSSGHVQAHCRENGLLCFYVKNGADIRYDVWNTLNNLEKGKTLRFVADGYRGNIY